MTSLRQPTRIWMARLVIAAPFLLSASAACGGRLGLVQQESKGSPTSSTTSSRVGDAATSSQPGEPADREAALKLAKWHAFQEGLLPHKTMSIATPNADGTWQVLFILRAEDIPGGQAVSIPERTVLVRVTPDGRCSSHGKRVSDDAGPWGQPLAPPVGPTEPSETLVDERVAVLLAKSFAMRQGLIPTETSVEECRTKDGGWVFSFTPGQRFSQDKDGSWVSSVLQARRFGVNSEDTHRSRGAPFIVVVSPSGECAAVPKGEGRNRRVRPSDGGDRPARTAATADLNAHEISATVVSGRWFYGKGPSPAGEKYTYASLLLRIDVENISEAPIVLVWTDPVKVSSCDLLDSHNPAEVLNLYTQSTRLYGVELYSAPTIHTRQLNPQERVSCESRYTRLVAPAVSMRTELAVATHLSPEELTRFLALDETDTYGGAIDWIQSKTLLAPIVVRLSALPEDAPPAEGATPSPASSGGVGN